MDLARQEWTLSQFKRKSTNHYQQLMVSKSFMIITKKLQTTCIRNWRPCNQKYPNYNSNWNIEDTCKVCLKTNLIWTCRTTVYKGKINHNKNLKKMASSCSQPHVTLKIITLRKIIQDQRVNFIKNKDSWKDLRAKFYLRIMILHKNYRSKINKMNMLNLTLHNLLLWAIPKIESNQINKMIKCK